MSYSDYERHNKQKGNQKGKLDRKLLCKIRTNNHFAAQINLQLDKQSIHETKEGLKGDKRIMIHESEYHIVATPNLNPEPAKSNIWSNIKQNHRYNPEYFTSTITRKKKRTMKEEFTLIGSMEMDIKLLHSIIDHLHLVVTHHPIKNKN